MSSSRRAVHSGTRGFAQLVEIDAPLARVWRALTDARLIRIWSGQEALVDAHQGGLYRLGARHAGGRETCREAHIDVFEVNRRLRLIYLNGPDMPPGESAVVDDFLLDVSKGARNAALRLLTSGVPAAAEWDAAYVRMRTRWERYLARLKVALENPPQPNKSPPPADPPPAGLDY